MSLLDGLQAVREGIITGHVLPVSGNGASVLNGADALFASGVVNEILSQQDELSDRVRQSIRTAFLKIYADLHAVAEQYPSLGIAADTRVSEQEIGGLFTLYLQEVFMYRGKMKTIFDAISLTNSLFLYVSANQIVRVARAGAFDTLHTLTVTDLLGQILKPVSEVVVPQNSLPEQQALDVEPLISVDEAAKPLVPQDAIGVEAVVTEDGGNLFSVPQEAVSIAPSTSMNEEAEPLVSQDAIGVEALMPKDDGPQHIVFCDEIIVEPPVSDSGESVTHQMPRRARGGTRKAAVSRDADVSQESVNPVADVLERFFREKLAVSLDYGEIAQIMRSRKREIQKDLPRFLALLERYSHLLSPKWCAMKILCHKATVFESRLAGINFMHKKLEADPRFEVFRGVKTGFLRVILVHVANPELFLSGALEKYWRFRELPMGAAIHKAYPNALAHAVIFYSNPQEYLERYCRKPSVRALSAEIDKVGVSPLVPVLDKKPSKAAEVEKVDVGPVVAVLDKYASEIEALVKPGNRGPVMWGGTDRGMIKENNKKYYLLYPAIFRAVQNRVLLDGALVLGGQRVNLLGVGINQIPAMLESLIQKYTGILNTLRGGLCYTELMAIIHWAIVPISLEKLEQLVEKFNKNFPKAGREFVAMVSSGIDPEAWLAGKRQVVAELSFAKIDSEVEEDDEIDDVKADEAEIDEAERNEAEKGDFVDDLKVVSEEGDMECDLETLRSDLLHLVSTEEDKRAVVGRINKIAKTPRMSPDESMALCRQYHALRKAMLLTKGRSEEDELSADEISPQMLRLRDKIVTDNLRLVMMFAWRFIRRNKAKGPITFEDLCQEGNIGLMRGIDKFDPDKGYQLSTYTSWWIRQAMDRFIQNCKDDVRKSVYVLDLRRRLQICQRTFFQKNGRWPDDEEILKNLGWSEARLQRVQKACFSEFSLDEPISNDEGDDSLTMMGALPGEGESIDISVANEEVVRHLWLAVHELDPLDREIAVRRVRDNWSLEMVGDRCYGVTRERIRKIELRIRSNLRKALEAQDWDAESALST